MSPWQAGRDGVVRIQLQALHLPDLSLPPNSSSLSHHQALCKVYIVLAQPYGQRHFLFKSLLLIHFFPLCKGEAMSVCSTVWLLTFAKVVEL